jgi:hypothetical protein
MVVGSAHTRVLVRDWVLVRDVGSTNAFEAVRRKAAVAGKMRPSIFVVQHDAARALARRHARMTKKRIRCGMVPTAVRASLRKAELC